MRHKISGKKLKRTSTHKKHMLSNMSISLFRYGRIKTTKAKAKELRRFVEPLITKAKNPTLHNKRNFLKKISDRNIMLKLFDIIAPGFKNRPGGYTRIFHLSNFRAGDNSDMVLIELLEKDNN